MPARKRKTVSLHDAARRSAAAPSGPAVEQPLFPGILKHIDLTPHKTIRLAVSGDVALSRLETRLVDTADFQRLRRIRQLGAACWIYPTALHTRFDHSLGTLAMAGRMIDALRANLRQPDAWREVSPEQEQLARLFALLHDTTHIPFGHTIEDECAVFPRHDDDGRRIERFLGEGSVLGQALVRGAGREMHGRLLGLFRAAAGNAEAALGEDHFILDLVAGAISADLLDYLRRDAFFCNLSIDADYRFLRALAVVPHEGRRRLMVRLWKEGAAQPRRDVLNELIRLLDNRYLLGERVYFHHAKLVAGAMVAGAAARAVRAKELALGDLYEVGDDVLLWRLQRGEDGAARRLAGALDARRLWKTIHVHPYRRAEAGKLEGLMRRFHFDAAGRIEEEDRLAARLGLDPGDLILYCPHFNMAMKPATTLVFWEGGPRALKECIDDPLIQARLAAILDSHQNLWSMRAFLNPDKLESADAAARMVVELLKGGGG